MEFIELKPGENLKPFDEVRMRLYESNPTLDAPAIEYLQSCYILKKEGRPIGRFALYQNPNLFYNEFPSVCIGNYECEENFEHSDTLLQKAVFETKKLGSSVLIGPMNGSIWENYRFADHQSNNQFLLEPFNRTYYNQQFIHYGFEKIANYYSSIDDSFKYLRPGIDQRELQLANNGYKFRNINLTQYESELENIYELSRQSFRHSFLYTDFNYENFLKKYLPLASFINPEFVILAEDSKGKLMGFIFCIQDLMHNSEKRLIIKTIARKPGKEAAGIGEILGKMVYSRATQNGYTSIIHALMNTQGSSANHSLRRTENILNTYSLYAKFI